MKKRAIFLIMCVMYAHTLCAQSAQEIELTLDEAIACALRENRAILFQAEDVRKAKAKLKEARAGLFPSLTMSASRATTRGLYEDSFSSTSTHLGARQNLFTGGKTIYTIEMNQYGVSVSQALLDKAKLEVVARVQKVFYTQLLTQELVTLNAHILENAKSHLVMLEQRYRKGLVSQSDILKAQEGISRTQEAYEASVNQAQAALALLKNLMYIEEAVSLSIRGSLQCEPREIVYDEAFLKAMQQRPEIRQYEAQIQSAKKATEIARSGTRPTIYASWDYYYSSADKQVLSAPGQWGDYTTFGVTVSWPFFDGLATRAKVEQALADLKEARLKGEQTKRDIGLELKEAYLALKNALAGIRAFESEVAVYKDFSLSAQKKYKEGVASSLELDDARLGLRIAEFNALQAQQEYLMAKVSFDKATGGLL